MTKEPTFDEMRIEICEWLGWRCTNEGWVNPDNVEESIPDLTLDWLHECWLKLTPEQRHKYLENIVGDDWEHLDEWLTIIDILVAFENASADQRFRALYRTVKL